MIASLLAVTVDLFLKEKLFREISLDAAKFLIGFSLPAEVQNAIRALIQTPLVRRNTEIRVHLREASERPGFVEIFAEIHEYVENVTSEVRKYKDTVEYEKHDPEKVTEMRCDSTDPKACYCLRETELNAQEKENEPGVMIVEAPEIKMDPHKAEQTYRFLTRYTVVLPETYSDVVSFGKPTVNVTLVATYPDTFTFSSAPATHWYPDRWEYHKLFLPGDHIRFRWRKKQT